MQPTAPANSPANANAASVDQIDAALPQTQCTRCGYPDCRGYAEAIASGAAAINRCPASRCSHWMPTAARKARAAWR